MTDKQNEGAAGVPLSDSELAKIRARAESGSYGFSYEHDIPKLLTLVDHLRAELATCQRERDEARKLAVVTDAAVKAYAEELNGEPTEHTYDETIAGWQAEAEQRGRALGKAEGLEDAAKAMAETEEWDEPPKARELVQLIRELGQTKGEHFCCGHYLGYAKDCPTCGKECRCAACERQTKGDGT